MSKGRYLKEEIQESPSPALKPSLQTTQILPVPLLAAQPSGFFFFNSSSNTDCKSHTGYLLWSLNIPTEAEEEQGFHHNSAMASN